MEDREALAVVSAAAIAARRIDEAVAAAERHTAKVDRIRRQLTEAEETADELAAAVDTARAAAEEAATRAAAILDGLPQAQQDRVLAEHAGKEFERDARLQTTRERRAYKDGMVGPAGRPDYVGAGVATADPATGKG